MRANHRRGSGKLSTITAGETERRAPPPMPSNFPTRC